MNDHQYTWKQGFPMQDGGSAESTKDFRPGLREKSQHNNLALFLSPLGLPFDVFLYPLQSSFLVRSWLGTVGPRALTGDPAGKTRDLRPKKRNLYIF
jgi:hypothetical protein